MGLTYQEELSTGESVCVPCPGNSFSIVEDSSECICFSGYYRTALEGPNFPCSSKILIDDHNKLFGQIVIHNNYDSSVQLTLLYQLKCM